MKETSSLICAIGSETTSLQDDEIRTKLYAVLDQIGTREDVFLLPPDFTRFHSQAGKITSMITEYYGYIKNTDESKEVPKIQIMPALGTHAPMTKEQIKTMFGEELVNEPQARAATQKDNETKPQQYMLQTCDKTCY